MDIREFKKMAEGKGYIGLPCSDFFEGDMSKITLEFEGPIGDVIARCYWADDNGNGGCISIPCDYL